MTEKPAAPVSFLHRPSTRKAGIGGAIAGVLVAAWAVGLVIFARQIPERVVDRLTRTDAIVILTGGSKRLDTGLRLLEENMAERVFVSGVHRDVDVDALLQIRPVTSDDLQCCVDAGYGALDTAGNAWETAGWMRRHGYRSLRLVTGSYHMPRSLLEFRYVMPDARVIPHPVFPEDVKVDRWWQWPGTAELIMSEYSKYLVSLTRHMLGTSHQAHGERPAPT